MTTMIEMGRIDWPRATLLIGTDNYGRVHFWGDGRTFHAENVNSELIASITVRDDAEGFPTVERVDAKTYNLTAEDGTVWVISKAGCACGG